MGAAVAGGAAMAAGAAVSPLSGTGLADTTTGNASVAGGAASTLGAAGGADSCAEGCTDSGADSGVGGTSKAGRLSLLRRSAPDAGPAGEDPASGFSAWELVGVSGVVMACAASARCRPARKGRD
ncbi:hypothetical protein M1E17_13730 [Arthrobacter sp. D1-29]